jgi:hypothetical protein
MGEVDGADDGEDEVRVVGYGVGLTDVEVDGADDGFDDGEDEVPVVGYGVGLTDVEVDGADDGLDVGFLVRFILVGLVVGGRDGKPWILAGF